MKATKSERELSLDFLRVTEAAAIESAKTMGQGDRKHSDHVAVEAMREVMESVPMRGRIVIGEGERDEAPMLYIGEEVGTKHGPDVDIALDPLEGTTICAKAGPNSLAVLAIAEKGGLLNAPDVYMDKLAVGPGYAKDVVSLDMSPSERVHALAKAGGVRPEDITVCILERPRHEEMIAEVVRAAATDTEPVKDVVIYGGGRIGLRLALALSSRRAASRFMTR